jgi:hypothetical protein
MLYRQFHFLFFAKSEIIATFRVIHAIRCHTPEDSNVHGGKNLEKCVWFRVAPRDSPLGTRKWTCCLHKGTEFRSDWIAVRYPPKTGSAHWTQLSRRYPEVSIHCILQACLALITALSVFVNVGGRGCYITKFADRKVIIQPFVFEAGCSTWSCRHFGTQFYYMYLFPNITT